MRKCIIFLLLISYLFRPHIYPATFFNPSPYTQNFGSEGYTAHWNSDGTMLTVGGTNFPYDGIVYSWDGTTLNQRTTLMFGNGIKSINWTSNGKFIAIGGSNSTYPLGIYQWDGATLTLTTSKYNGSQVNAVAWNPTNTTLAVGCNRTNNCLALYQWDGTNSLTLTSSRPHGTQINALAWHPAGTYLAVAGIYGAQDLIIYDWNGTVVSEKTPRVNTNQGDGAYAAAWNSSGGYLAVGASNNGYNNLTVYAWNGTALTVTASAHFGTRVNSISWSFDDRYVAVGGAYTSQQTVIYEFNGTSLTKIYSSLINYGDTVNSVSWAPYADYLAIAGGTLESTGLDIYTTHGYLNGTKNNMLLTNHYLFSDGGYAIDNINFTSGCTVLPVSTAAPQKLIMSILTPFSGGLDLRKTSTLQLNDDFYLDANATLSSGGAIYGQGHAIYLGNTLTIPDYAILYITSNTIIDGNGHDLKLGHKSQFLVDWNVTLTLRNLVLKNTYNNTSIPQIRLNGKTSKLALDNVNLACSSDFTVTYGQLFIHNDVVISGTSQFTYLTPRQSYIDTASILYFDTGTTFSFAPYFSPGMIIASDGSNSMDLLYMKDRSCILNLNNATLAITHTGLRLTRGQLILENNVTFSSQYYEGSHKQAKSRSLVLGNSTRGPSYDLNVQIRNNALITRTGMIKYDNYY